MSSSESDTTSDERDSPVVQEIDIQMIGVDDATATAAPAAQLTTAATGDKKRRSRPQA